MKRDKKRKVGNHCLVTGGAGFIGSALVKELVKKGWTVDVVDNLTSGSTCNLAGDDVNVVTIRKDGDDRWPAERVRKEGDVFCYVCDFDDPLLLERVRWGCYSVVFHQAAIPSVPYSVDHPSQTTDVNVGGTVRLLEACVPRVERVILASSAAVYGLDSAEAVQETDPKRPRSPYALQKLVTEDFGKLFSRLYKLQVVCLRYFNVYGPGQKAGTPYSGVISSWCHSIKEGQPLRVDGDGLQTRDMVYIDDVVQANILAATKSFPTRLCRVYNVGSGTSVSNKEILDYLKRRCSKVTVEEAPARAGDVHDSLADVKKIRKELKFRPQVTFWDGLKETLRWWQI